MVVTELEYSAIYDDPSGLAFQLFAEFRVADMKMVFSILPGVQVYTMLDIRLGL